jgi:hypothetical protein
MMSDKPQIALLLEEFVELYNDAPFELIEGARIPLVPPLAEHGNC